MFWKRTYQHTRSNREDVPVPSVELIKIALDILAYQSPQAKQTDPNLIIDPLVVRKIDQSGFIRLFTRNDNRQQLARILSESDRDIRGRSIMTATADSWGQENNMKTALKHGFFLEGRANPSDLLERIRRVPSDSELAREFGTSANAKSELIDAQNDGTASRFGQLYGVKPERRTAAMPKNRLASQKSYR
ncbi:MAG TPA: hypothetical protein VE616_12830 [Candidatus Udaeobacter sp.]|jgi:hypothetical protein|nr:hypothetical protein [Candidatus Udaeobacter sp.]